MKKSYETAENIRSIVIAKIPGDGWAYIIVWENWCVTVSVDDGYSVYRYKMDRSMYNSYMDVAMAFVDVNGWELEWREGEL